MEEGFMLLFSLIMLGVAVGICYAFGKICESMVRNKGYTDTKVYFWIGFFTGVIGIIIAAVAQDKTPVVRNVREERRDNMDELRKYKDLFDAGAITQEEYERIKRELLKL